MSSFYLKKVTTILFMVKASYEPVIARGLHTVYEL